MFKYISEKLYDESYNIATKIVTQRVKNKTEGQLLLCLGQKYRVFGRMMNDE
jgi:hypothetical protein